MSEQGHKEDGKEPEIGEELPDGRVYAGVSPKTGKAMYLVDGAFDGSLEEAQAALANLAPHGWRAPSKNEAFAAMAKDGAATQLKDSFFWSVTDSHEQPELEGKAIFLPRIQPPKSGGPPRG